MGFGRIVPELLRNLLHRPVTVRYPFEKVPAPPGLRGRPVCQYDKCVGCSMCAKDCPALAIEMVGAAPRALRPVFHYDRCAFCGQCADSCPRKCITMTAEYELSALSKEELVGGPEQKSNVAD